MPGVFSAGASVVIHRNGRVLLLKRSASKDHGAGESFEAAAVREAFEETGLTVTLGRPFDTFAFVRETGEELLGVTFAASSEGDEVRLTDEHQEARWADAEDMRGIELLPPVRHALEIFWETGAERLGC
jgi:8-oxo-dGTP diphosphatase